MSAVRREERKREKKPKKLVENRRWLKNEKK